MDPSRGSGSAGSHHHHHHHTSAQPTMTTSSAGAGGGILGQHQQHHQQFVANANTIEVMELTAASLKDRATHQSMLLDMEAKNRAFQIDVPTLPKDVKISLRSLGLPIRLFGENLANVRDRLRMELSRNIILQEQRDKLVASGTGNEEDNNNDITISQTKMMMEEEDDNVTKYSRATKELITARERISIYSLQRAKHRLEKERLYRLQYQRKRMKLNRLMLGGGGDDNDKEEEEDNDKNDNSTTTTTTTQDIDKIDELCLKSYKQLRNIGLEGSQYGDTRPLSSIATSYTPIAGYPLIATGGWSGTIQLWDGSSPELNLLGRKSMAHEDRIMSIAILQPSTTSTTSSTSSTTDSNHDTTMIATASIDLTAKLWKVQRKNHHDNIMTEEEANNNITTSQTIPSTTTTTTTTSEEDNEVLSITQMAHLKGHAARLCCVAFHPQGQYVATTSFDHTWRLWDIETSTTTTTTTNGQQQHGQILLQDGHWKEVYGIGFHPDGSLCASTDYGGVVQCWDLRTGKSICHFLGHAKRVLCSEFAPNGYQLATAGDDGTIKIWDLRQRKQFVSIPAHSNLITQLKFHTTTTTTNTNGTIGNSSSTNGEYLASSSFDGTAKVWSTRDWKMLATLRGHQGKVMGIDLLQDNSFVTSGFDKTLKLWR